MNSLSEFTLLPDGFMEQEKCELYSLDNPVFLPDGKEFLTWEKTFKFSKTYHVDKNNPVASDNNPGSEELPWQTINNAAGKLMPGEHVVIHEGIYREKIIPKRGGAGPDAMISYEGAEGENVVIRGSELFKDDFTREDSAWRMKLPEPFATSNENPFILPNYEIVPWDGENKELYDEEKNVRERLMTTVKEHAPNAFMRQGGVYQNGKRLLQTASKDELNKRR